MIQFIFQSPEARFMKKIKLKTILKVIALSLTLALLASTPLLIPAEAVDTSSMGVLLDSFASNNNTFTLGTASRFFIVAASEPSADLVKTVQLAQKQFAAAGYPSTTVMPIVWGSESMALAGDIVVNLAPSSSLVDDGYQLNVTTKAKVTAKNTRGLIYGLNTLLKHFRTAKRNVLKGFTAQDEPDTIERTVHLDCARKYYTKEWICNFIREMSWMGYNKLELHFSEDGGFRIDFWDPEIYVDGGYKPTNDFSWVCGSTEQWWNPNTKDPDKGKCLTGTELVEIIQVAKEYQIDVFPSFDSPGHVDWMTWTYYNQYKTNSSIAKFTYNGTNYTLPSQIHFRTANGGTFSSDFKCLDLSKDSVQKFALAMYADIADFFKYYAGSTDFNICADEVALTSTDNWNYVTFYNYINSLSAMLKGKGYTVRMYNDFVARTDYSSGLTMPTLDKDIQIVYWDGPNAGTLSKNFRPVTYFLNTENRVVYNGLAIWNYYALRVVDRGVTTSDYNYLKDARAPCNTMWSMTHTMEDTVYSEWNPSRFSEPGDTLYNYSGSLLGGGYFMIWCDYAGLNTEWEIWKGIADNDCKCGTYHYYSLRERMWSNITKMWNWDINSTVTSFSTFETLRDNMGDFPGLDSSKGTVACSSAAVLPAATAPTQIISQSTLSSTIGTKLAKGIYTDASYSAYSTAYDAAKAAATDTSMTAAEQATYSTLLSNYKTAYNALTIKTFTIKVNHYVKGTTTAVKSSETHTTTTSSNHYEIGVTNLSNYAVDSVSGSSYTTNSSGVTLYGDATSNLTITVYYKEIVDFTQLNALIATGDHMSSTYYTTESWSNYSAALSSAKAVAANGSATQTQVNDAADALQAAYDALESVGDPKATPLTVELLSTVVPKGKQVGIRVMSDPSVETLTITRNGVVENQIFCSSQVQQLYDGDMVRCWLVFIDADTVGTFTYTINDSINVTVTVV